MSNRAQRRRASAEYRAASGGSLTTWLVGVSDPLDGVLEKARAHWLGHIGIEPRHCFICGSLLITARDVSAILLSRPANGTHVGIVGACTCWLDASMDEIERKASEVLAPICPHGKFEPLEPRVL